MTKKILYLFIIFNLIQLHSFAQKQGQALIDSLLLELPIAKEDTKKVKVLYILCDNFRLIGEYDKGLHYGNQGLKLAQKINYKQGIAASYNNIGNAYESQSNYEKSLKNHFASLKISQEIQNKQGIAASYNNIGNVYESQGNYEKSLENHFASLKIRQAMHDKQGISASYNNIGNVYESQGNYEKSLENYFASLKIRQEMQNKQGIASSYNNIGNVYSYKGNYNKALENHFASLKISQEMQNKQGIANSYNNIGVIYMYKGNYDKSLENYFASLKIEQEMQNKQGIADSYNNIGLVYDDKGNYNKALENYFASLKILKEIGDKEGIATSHHNIGNTYVKQHKIKEAKEQQLLSLCIAKEIGSKAVIRLAYQNLAQCDSAASNWQGAYEYHKLYKEFHDSIFNEESEKKTAQMSALYESEKKEAAIKLLEKDKEKQAAISAAENKRQKTILFSVIGGFVVVLLFAGVFYRQRNKISKEKKRSDELLLNILPSEVAEELKETGSAKAKSFDNVTVLFTDFKNFTQASEKLSAEELVHEINYCYSEFDKIITMYGIEKIKTIGDSYMCAGGLPSTNDTHPWDLVNAGLELQQFIIKHKAERIAVNEPYFELRLGIHTGPVVAGIVGIKKFAYDIWGDTVNTASRMESSGEVGKVNISGATYDLVKDKFKCFHRGKIQAKNKGEIDMYFVEGKV